LVKVQILNLFWVKQAFLFNFECYYLFMAEFFWGALFMLIETNPMVESSNFLWDYETIRELEILFFLKPFFPRAIEHLGVTSDVLPQG